MKYLFVADDMEGTVEVSREYFEKHGLQVFHDATLGFIDTADTIKVTHMVNDLWQYIFKLQDEIKALKEKQ